MMLGLQCVLLLHLLMSVTAQAVNGSNEHTFNSSGTETCPSKTRTLYLLALAPFPDTMYPDLSPVWEGGPAVIPASQLAVRHLNSRYDILEHYKLELLVADSGCDIAPKTVVSFADGVIQMSNLGRNVVGIIGPGCSASAKAIGDILARDESALLHISPSAVSPDLLNIDRFSNTFRPIGTYRSHINMYSSLIQSLNLTTIAIFYDTKGKIHAAAATEFERRAKSIGVLVQSFGISRSAVDIPLSAIENKLRIIFVFSTIKLSTNLLCLAYHRNMFYPNYQYIFRKGRLGDFLTSTSFSFEGETFNCSREEMGVVTNGTITSLTPILRRDRNTILVNNMNYNQFTEEYEQARNAYVQDLGLSSDVKSDYRGVYYDSVWALALALNSSIPRLHSELNASLSDYRYGLPQMTSIIRSELLQVNFEGIRGTISFNKRTHSSEDVTVICVSQVKDEVEIELGFFDSRTELLYFGMQGSFIQDIFDQVEVTPPFYVEIVVFLFVIVIMAVTTFFHVVNLKWSRVSSIKVTSPALNNFIFLGCCMYVLSIIFVSFQGVVKNGLLFRIKCCAFIWCECIAFTLIFGTICVKTWRILHIFKQSSTRKMNNLQTYRLALLILGLVLFDVVLNLIWNIVDLWDIETTFRDVLYYRVVCRCKYLNVWIGILLSSKALLIIIVLYLTIASRKIPRKEYKQTKATNSLVYVFIIIYALLLPFYVIFLEETQVGLVTLSYLCICFKNILCVIMCNVLIFLPPVLPILKRKYSGQTSLHALLTLCTR